MQLASMKSPRSVRISDTCRYASGYCRYQRTASRITSPGYWRPLNGFVGVIGMDSYPTRDNPNLRNGTQPAENTDGNPEEVKATLVRVVPISLDSPVITEEIAKLAYKYWLEREGVGGTPEEDWFRAEKSVR